jgi:hypothetical protein
MRQAVRLDRMKPLKVQKRLDQPSACRIAIEHRHDIRPESRADRLVGGNRLSENIGNEESWNNLIAKPRRNPVNDRVLEARPV